MKINTGIALLATTMTVLAVGACALGSGNTTTASSGTQSAVQTLGSGSIATVATETLFTERDLTQEADATGAVQDTLTDGAEILITGDETHILSGTAKNVTVIVDAGSEDKVQLILDGVQITNDDFPCIYVKNADKVFVTTTDSENSLSVTGTFRADGDTNTDAVVFSRDDLVLNGTGTLKITSTDNGIASKDDIKITGGTLSIECTADALEANNDILMSDGNVTVRTPKDGLHAEDDDDPSHGAIYIGGGTLTVEAGDDAVHATTDIRIDGGSLTLTAAEGLEATQIFINDGEINIAASDDGINAGWKSGNTTPLVEINGGSVTIVMGEGDTDAIDSNGTLIIAGGTLDITARSPFDYDGAISHTGGTIIVNGKETDTVTNQQMGGPGGRGGGRR